MNTLVIIAAAAGAHLGSALLVFSIQQLELEHGSHHFALQEDVAARVSVNEICRSFLFSAGVVTSPNHPDKYPENLDQTQTLQVQRGKILRLEFTRFAVQSCGDVTTCPCHYVKITDGDGTTLMDNSCGYSSRDPSWDGYFQPPTVTTKTNTVEIFFHTDGSGTRSGWSLSWSAVTPGLKDFIRTASFIHLNCHYKHFYVESMAIKMDQISDFDRCFSLIILD